MKNLPPNQMPSNSEIADRNLSMVNGFPMKVQCAISAAPRTASASGVPLMKSTGVVTPRCRTLRMKSTPLWPGNR